MSAESLSKMSQETLEKILVKAKRAQRVEFMTMIGFSFTAAVLSYILFSFYQPNFVMSQPKEQEGQMMPLNQEGQMMPLNQEGQMMSLDQAPYFDNIKAALFSLLIGAAVYVIYAAFFARLQV